MTDILWPKAVALALTPPGIIVVLGLIGLFLTIWRRWLGSTVIALALGALFALSLPLVGKRLLMQVEAPFLAEVITPNKPAANVQAIVILGGGRYNAAPEYGGDTIGQYTLERVRYGARLARETNLPILVSSGSVFGEEKSEAELMQQALERDFGVKVKWAEPTSRTTLENAVHTKTLLAQAGIRRVYLVTHAWHMPRAQWSFADVGLDTVPAPTAFTTISKSDLSPLGYLPSVSGLEQSTLALRERIGLYWYKSKRDAKVAAEVVAPAATPAK